MQLIMDLMRLMLTTITCKHNTAVYCIGYRSSMVIVQGKMRSDKEKKQNKDTDFKRLNSRLHHDQQAAHALESAYSNYPMSGEFRYLNLRKIRSAGLKERINQ